MPKQNSKRKKGQEQLYLEDMGKVEITTDKHQRVVTRGHCCHIYKKYINMNFWQKEKKKKDKMREIEKCTLQRRQNITSNTAATNK